MTTRKYALSIALTVFAASCAQGPDRDLAPGSDKADELSDQCIAIERREPLTEADLLDDASIAKVMASKGAKYLKQDLQSTLEEVTDGNVIPRTDDSPTWSDCKHTDYDNGYTVADCGGTVAILTRQSHLMHNRNKVFDVLRYSHTNVTVEVGDWEQYSTTRIILDDDDSTIAVVEAVLPPEVQTGGCSVVDENPTDPDGLHVLRSIVKEGMDAYNETLNIGGSGHWKCDAANATFKCSAVR